MPGNDDDVPDSDDDVPDSDVPDRESLDSDDPGYRHRRIHRSPGGSSILCSDSWSNSESERTAVPGIYQERVVRGRPDGHRRRQDLASVAEVGRHDRQQHDGDARSRSPRPLTGPAPPPPPPFWANNGRLAIPLGQFTAASDRIEVPSWMSSSRSAIITEAAGSALSSPSSSAPGPVDPQQVHSHAGGSADAYPTPQGDPCVLGPPAKGL